MKSTCAWTKGWTLTNVGTHRKQQLHSSLRSHDDMTSARPGRRWAMACWPIGTQRTSAVCWQWLVELWRVVTLSSDTWCFWSWTSSLTSALCSSRLIISNFVIFKKKSILYRVILTTRSSSSCLCFVNVFRQREACSVSVVIQTIFWYSF